MIPAPRRATVSSLAGVLVGGAAFLASLMNFGSDVGRSATGVGYAANFFEVQARALLEGHLWVPQDSLSIEGFEQPDGHTYMYFGLFPALLRIPMLMVTDDFNGRLTVTSMALAWIVFAVFVCRLCWLVRDLLGSPADQAGDGGGQPTRTEAVLAAGVIAGLTGGTVLTFDAALPWVYHEVYLWQSAWVMASAYWMVRVVVRPGAQAYAWLGACALGAALTRTTGGWGVCLAVLALAAWMAWGRSTTGLRGWARWCLAAGAVPLALGIVVNVAKFGHAYMFPLENQVWTDLNEHRREALEVNGGTITGPQFFLGALHAYFGVGVRFVGYFPWVTLPAEPPQGHGAFIDQAYRTGSVTGFMGLFLLLALLAVPVLLRRTSGLFSGSGVRALRAPALAAFLMTGGVMGYGYFAFRYTSEFVPALALGTLISLWAWLVPLSRRGRVGRIAVAVVVAVATSYGILAHTAVGLTAAALQHQGDPLARYLDWQNSVSGGPGSAFARLITTSDSLPGDGVADRVHIVGDCNAVYVATGETDQPWVLAEARNQVLEIGFPSPLRDGETVLFEVAGETDREVLLRTRRDRFAWLVFRNEDGRANGNPFQPSPGETMRVGLRSLPDYGLRELSSSPGGFAAYVPEQEWDADWRAVFRDATTPWTGPGTDPDTRVRVRPAEALEPELCRRLVATNGIELR